MMKKIFEILPLIFVVIAVVLMVIKVVGDNKAGLSGSSALSYYDSPLIGKIAPNIDGVDFKGSKTVINIFASWCSACLLEHSIFLKIAKQKNSVSGDNIQLVGVSWRDKSEDSDDWLKRHGNPYDFVSYDSLGKYGISLGIRGVPETFVIDEDGRVTHHVRGNITSDFADMLLNQGDVK